MIKILMPSNDYLTIAPNFENAKAFRLLTVINGLIKEDSFIFPSNDLRDKYPFGLKELSDSVVQDENSLNIANLNYKDKLNRNIVIASGISIETEKNLQKINYNVFHTEETNIFNALISYINNYAAMESDYCCCP
jgi:predicted Fe-Mo cluster-binding NifX family protein